MNKAGPWHRMGHVKCFSCGETGHIARYCRSNVQRPYPRPGICQSRTGKNIKVTGEQPVAVKLDKESGGDMDDVMEMREVMVRTGNDRCTFSRSIFVHDPIGFTNF